MFTGLIETTGEIRRLERRGPGVRVSISTSSSFVSELALGESVACDGACLTVVSAKEDLFVVEASGETMEVTTLSKKRIGDSLHLERALALGDRLGGHLVTGHVDAVGVVRSKRAMGESTIMTFDAPASIARYIIPKGSISIDGVSLTVNHTDDSGFDVVLIPHTQSVVNLAHKRIGDPVNLESDLIGKYVEHLLSTHDRGPSSSRVSEALLREAGFVS